MILYWTGLGLVIAATLYSLAMLCFAKDPVVVSDFAPIIAWFRRNAALNRIRMWIAVATAVGFILCALGIGGIFAPVIYGFGAGVNIFMTGYWRYRRCFWLAWAQVMEETAVDLFREVIEDL
jgi:hypothetical protein